MKQNSKNIKNIDSLPTMEKERLLKKYRKRIDFFDRILVFLLNGRTKAAVMIGRIKISLNQPTYNPDRERDVIKRINSHNKGPLTGESLGRIYERILDESRATQKAESHKLMNNPENKEKKKSIGELLSRKEWLVVIAFFVLLMTILIYTFFSPNHYNAPGPFTFELKRGQTLNNTIDSLYKHGIIPNRRNMRIASFFLGGGRNLKAGRYRIPNDLSYVGLLDLFIVGKREVPVLVDVYPGINIYQLSGQLHSRVHLDSAEVLRLCRDKAFLKSLGISNAPSLEGYMLPAAYFFYIGTPASEVLTKIKNEFDRFFTDSLLKQAAKSRYSLNEILTVASIVEGETPKVEEYPVIAGVYYNRLRIGMKLQADPTIQYARMGKWKRLYEKDLNFNSPYNTYLYSGLPPGPINNPGKAAILAALNPAKHKFIYFVADGSGGHKFSATYSEHLKSVQKYRQWLGKQTQR